LVASADGILILKKAFVAIFVETKDGYVSFLERGIGGVRGKDS